MLKSWTATSVIAIAIAALAIAGLGIGALVGQHNRGGERESLVRRRDRHEHESRHDEEQALSRFLDGPPERVEEGRRRGGRTR